MSSLLKLLLCMVSLLHGKREILISKKEGGGYSHNCRFGLIKKSLRWELFSFWPSGTVYSMAFEAFAPGC